MKKGSLRDLNFFERNMIHKEIVDSKYLIPKYDNNWAMNYKNNKYSNKWSTDHNNLAEYFPWHS